MPFLKPDRCYKNALNFFPELLWFHLEYFIHLKFIIFVRLIFVFYQMNFSPNMYFFHIIYIFFPTH